jgi:(p)ppGpp synthase/HD superfamily hydrolase
MRTMLTERFDAALLFAHEVHRTQTRKGTPVPYVAHVLGVATLTLEYGGEETEAIGALLHDAIEDAPAALGGAQGVRARIREEFGETVLGIVEHCTDTDQQPKPPWRVRKSNYLAHLPTAPPDALLVSAADKLYNATAVLRDFRAHGEALWQRFNADAGKAGTIGYYRALADIYTRQLPNPISADLQRLVSMLEHETGHAGTWPPR